jgi:uncharacterized protein YgbK (DUF1537 family)
MQAMQRIDPGSARYLVIDALRDEDLVAIGEAAAQDILVSGGSGIALGLPENFRKAKVIGSARTEWVGEDGPAVALCGSCSLMSRRQIAEHQKKFPAREAAADAIVQGIADPNDYADWALAEIGASGPPLIYSSAEPDVVARIQQRYGREQVAHAVESFFSSLACLLVRRGVRRLVSAGGETSGAVVSGLAIPSFAIGPEIDSGVPALRAQNMKLVLALKSGNFGGPDFFAKAARVLRGTAADE